MDLEELRRIELFSGLSDGGSKNGPAAVATGPFGG